MDEVEQGQAGCLVLLGDGHHQPQVGLHERALGLVTLAAGAHQLAAASRRQVGIRLVERRSGLVAGLDGLGQALGGPVHVRDGRGIGQQGLERRPQEILGLLGLYSYGLIGNLVSAFIGAVALLWMTDQTLSVATLVGFVALGGIASRNGILLLDHYLHLMKEEGRPFSHETLIQAGRERIVPVLMTALTSGIALVPILLTPDAPGRELLYPVASVIVGGLFSTTLLDLLLTPGVFWLFGRGAAEKHTSRVDPADGSLDEIARQLAAEFPTETP